MEKYNVTTRKDGRKFYIGFCAYSNKYEIIEDKGITGHYNALEDYWMPVTPFDNLENAIEYMNANIDNFV